MRVLLISTNGLLHDGITAWMTQYFSVMDKTGIEPHTVAWEGTSEHIINAVNASGIAVHLLPSRRLHVVKYLHALYKLLCQMRFDIVHVCGNSGTIALELVTAAKCSVKMRIAHSRNTMCVHRVADKFLRPLMFSSATDFFACGTEAGKWLFESRPFAVIPNGKDSEKYAFSDVKRKHYLEEIGISAGKVVIGHVGMFNEQKNHAKLIEIFSVLRRRSDKYFLCLVGDGSLREEMELKVELLGLKDSVAFLGRRLDVPDLLNIMDCMVLPSLYEGFPNVVLEWQLNGLPCVISDTVTDECAITPLVSFVSLKGDDSCWADAVERALLQGDRCHNSEFAAKAAKLKGFDIRDNAAMLKNLYIKGVAR